MNRKERIKLSHLNYQKKLAESVRRQRHLKRASRESNRADETIYYKQLAELCRQEEVWLRTEYANGGISAGRIC